MTNNDIIISIRYTLHLKNSEVVELFALAGEEISNLDTVAILKRDDEDGHLPCSDEQLHNFLDGLIVKNRGPKDGPAPKINKRRIDNNMILRKLRIAFTLKDTDVIDILKLTNFRMSKGELGAMARKRIHPNYTECGDQFMRNFLRGLTLKLRPKDLN